MPANFEVENKEKNLTNELSSGNIIDGHVPNIVMSGYIKKSLIILGIIALVTGVVLFILPLAKWIAGCVLGAGLLSTGSGLAFDKIKFGLKELFGSDSQHVPEGLGESTNSVYDKVSELEKLPGDNNGNSPKVTNSEERENQNH